MLDNERFYNWLYNVIAISDTHTLESEIFHTCSAEAHIWIKLTNATVSNLHDITVTFVLWLVYKCCTIQFIYIGLMLLFFFCPSSSALLSHHSPCFSAPFSPFSLSLSFSHTLSISPPSPFFMLPSVMSIWLTSPWCATWCSVMASLCSDIFFLVLLHLDWFHLCSTFRYDCKLSWIYRLLSVKIT